MLNFAAPNHAIISLGNSNKRKRIANSSCQPKQINMTLVPMPSSCEQCINYESF